MKGSNVTRLQTFSSSFSFFRSCICFVCLSIWSVFAVKSNPQWTHQTHASVWQKRWNITPWPQSNDFTAKPTSAAVYYLLPMTVITLHLNQDRTQRRYNICVGTVNCNSFLYSCAGWIFSLLLSRPGKLVRYVNSAALIHLQMICIQHSEDKLCFFWEKKNEIGLELSSKTMLHGVYQLTFQLACSLINCCLGILKILSLDC